MAQGLRLPELLARGRLASGRWPVHVFRVWGSHFGDGGDDLRPNPYASDRLVHRLLAVCHRQGRDLGLELEAHPGDRLVPDRVGDAASTPFGIGASRSRSVDRDRAPVLSRGQCSRWRGRIRYRGMDCCSALVQQTDWHSRQFLCRSGADSNGFFSVRRISRPSGPTSLPSTAITTRPGKVALCRCTCSGLSTFMPRTPTRFGTIRLLRKLCGTTSGNSASYCTRHPSNAARRLYPQFPTLRRFSSTTIVEASTTISGKRNTTTSSGIFIATQTYLAPIQAAGTTLMQLPSHPITPQWQSKTLRRSGWSWGRGITSV